MEESTTEESITTSSSENKTKKQQPIMMSLVLETKYENMNKQKLNQKTLKS